MHKLSLTVTCLLIAIFLHAQSPHGKDFKMDCAQCHTSDNWSFSKAAMHFSHDSTPFKLTGEHRNANCKDCHSSLVFKDQRQSCMECHTDMHNNTLGKDCGRCHTPSSWLIQNTRELHLQSRFPLLGAHRMADCTDCHTSSSRLQFEPVGIECSNCHMNDYQRTTSPNHVAKGFSTICTECHSVSSNSWNTTTVNHDFFPLTAGHAIGCTQCHVSGKFDKLPTDCNNCHQKDYNQTQLPGHVAAGIPSTCAECHTSNAWKPSSFNHISTGFELKGGHHSVVQCSDCHKGNLSSAQPQCIYCHQVQYDNALNHKKLGYPVDCTLCHSETNWLQASFNHSSTSFPLTGAHISVECNLCHTSGFKGTPSECNSCHQKNYSAAQLPSHVAAGIPNTCASCHTTTAYKPSTFNHTTTGFELKGGHQSVVQCSDCHKGNLSSAQSQCISCHQVQYDTAPNHRQLGYPTDCTQCHSQANWLQASFNHSTTSFPLTGAHISVECNLCHTNGFKGTPSECNSCHQKNYSAAQLPSHVAAGIPNTCAECHTSNAWKPSSFNHTTTGFELKGGHQTIVQCSDCHKGNLSSAQSQCISCHQVQYDTAPNHKQLGYPTDCTNCHSQANWLQASFDHSTTSFPLTGAHTSVECNLCHTSGFKGTPTDCNSCHQKDFNQAQLPSHVAAGIPTTCASCHTTTAYKPSTFNHTTTGFELKGGHQSVVQCSDCHKGNLSSAQSQCISCHQVQYDTAPNHKQSGYPTNCATCHSQNNWLENIFNHTSTGFTLTGAHISVTCTSCHANGFTGTPTDCYSCHSARYNSTTNPNHQGAGFPTTCATCHSTTNWTSSTFNHSAYFPITTSRHNVRCATCHTNSGNYTVFSCVTSGCHTSAHNQNQGSAGCYRCHPNGKGD
ncbi:MAG TPA: hypothetical protein VK205_15820 [Prolixibacteraceae bacterium]|nr:hypothetical protein [Prolixibacteraceae bacterium]